MSGLLSCYFEMGSNTLNSRKFELSLPSIQAKLRVMQNNHPREVENFTGPFLVSAGMVVFVGLIVLWASFGYVAALVSGFVLRRLIDWLPVRD